MSKFSEFEEGVLSGAKDLAVGTLKDLATIIEDDANAFLKSSAEKLKRWTRMLAKEQITRAEFTALVESQRALATLEGLTHAGIAAASLQRLRDKLIDLVIDTAFKTFLPI
ncbi:Ulp1 family protease [Nitrobacteraceae bacterium AZCC 1564]